MKNGDFLAHEGMRIRWLLKNVAGCSTRDCLADKQVRSDNDASEVGIWDILGHFGTFWDNSEDFLTSLDLLDGHFRPFSSIIGSFKKPHDGCTDDGRTDPLIQG